MNWKIFIISLYVTTISGHPENETSDLESHTEGKELEPTVLSRKKRFLTFPDGSSLQLVFCEQNHGYLHVGDIVWFANTAALAWELPSDPSLFHLFKQYERHDDDHGQRRQDNKHIVYLDENLKILSKVPYHKKPRIIPVFAKRSVDNQKIFKDKIKEMHEVHRNNSYFGDLDENSIEFHRSGRASLYEKVETFFKGLGWRGKECVLRMLCEHKKPRNGQGTFVDEILRATFTLPRGRNSDLKEYDIIHDGSNCENLYPQCESLRGLPLFNESQ